MLMASDRYADADEYFARALAVDPHNAAALGGRAVAASNLRQFSRAVEFAREGITHAPDNSWNLYVMGWVLSSNGKRRKAIEYFDQAIAINPSDARSFAGRGNCRLSLGDYSAAQADARESLRHDPDSDNAMNLLGLSLFHSGSREEGIAVLEACRALHPQDARTHENLGRCYQAAGSHSLATDSFRRAIQLNPSEHRVITAMLWSARKRHLLIWYFESDAGKSHMSFVALFVVLIGVPLAIVRVTSLPQPEVATYTTAGAASVLAVLLVASEDRSLLKSFWACAERENRRLVPPAVRIAAVTYGFSLAAGLCTLAAAIIRLSPGLAWVSMAWWILAFSARATQLNVRARAFAELTLAFAAIAWFAIGTVSPETRWWTVGGAVLIGLLSARLMRLRQRMIVTQSPSSRD